MIDKYYQVNALTDDPAAPAKAWYDSFIQAHPCLHWNPEVAVDVILDDLGESAALTVVAAVGVRLARLDLLEVLCDDVGQYLTLGKVHSSDGKLINNYRTIGAVDRTLEIRGGPESTRQFCKICKQFLYYPMGSRYIVESNLTGQALYYASLGPLVIRQDLLARVDGRTWDKVEILEIPVIAKPLDGLPADLTQVTPANLPHIVDLIRLIGWEGQPVAEVREGIKPLVEKHGERFIDAATKDLFQVDSDARPPFVQLTDEGRRLAVQVLGPAPHS